MIDTALQTSFQERFSTIRALEKKALVSEKQALSMSFMDLDENGFFEFQGNTYCIREKNRYEETDDRFKTKKGYFIYELTCLCIENGKTVFFEWEYDDELEITMTLDRHSFRDMADELGEKIDEDDLDQIADDKDAIVINNEKYWYEDDWPAIFERGDRQEHVYMYEFENQDSTRFLTIEEWQGSGRDEYRIYTSIPVTSKSIRIISKGDRQG